MIRRPPSVHPAAPDAWPRRLRALGLAVLLVAASAAPLWACSIVPLHWVRHARATAMVLDPLADSVYAGTFIPQRLDERTWRFEPDSARAVPVYGQVFRVREVVARGERLPAGVRPGARVVMIRWGLTGMCGRDAPWPALPPGEAVFFVPVPRAQADWVGGMPTFDADAGGDHGYVPASWRARGGGLARLFHGEPMTAHQYARMYRAMPTAEAWQRSPRSATLRVLRWARDNPATAQRAPAPRMLRGLGYTAQRMRDEAREGRARGADQGAGDDASPPGRSVGTALPLP